MRLFGYSLDQWERTAPNHKGEMVVHLLERNLREAYQIEEARRKSDKAESRPAAVRPGKQARQDFWGQMGLK